MSLLVSALARLQLVLEVYLFLVVVVAKVEVVEIKQVLQLDLAVAGLQLELPQIHLRIVEYVGNEL